ncbi:MAG TPA: 1,4-alpha-glucan branching protein GlgB [Candidatus Saccharimonadales bacterium]|nr:1,4-alpha-glucan branching protein GlgB [Candidatus Saccharimonadales bacterium]
MILTKAEADSLTEVRHRSPHQLLGMHPLGDGSGVVARVFAPGAAEVEIIPTHEKDKPRFRLQQIQPGLFEGTSAKSKTVFAYDAVITEQSGEKIQRRDPYSFLPTVGETDLYLFGQGNERRIYEKLGAQLRTIDGATGASFAVWAPDAQRISVVGDFNRWDGRRHAMRSLGSSGVWELFIPGVGEGAHYKFEIKGRNGALMLKTDPYGFFFEIAPKNAAIVWNNQKFAWDDEEWMQKRSQQDPFRRPMSAYELHLGSWMKKNNFESLSYREIAEPLTAYLQNMGFTHVEFMPLAEHAFYPSWGYQVTGFYAPTSRFGTPDDFQFLVNQLHRAGIAVLLDWVPAHFPRDDWALAQFDGTALYEHEDPRKGSHQDWGTLIFNYGRHEVRNFLIANALFWCDRFHLDGLRVDAVASMLYLDYSRKAGEWVPNQFGGRENLEAVDFIKHFNHVVQTEYPGVVTVAEESTAWPLVTRPPYLGGLGFTFKWNMGWMHDTLVYFKRDAVYRKYHQTDLTFAMLYHYNENFILPLSHDEVVHGKGSLLARMPGDDWQRFANLRALLAYQWFFPGKQLLMMGCELGQSGEWNANASLDWGLLDQGPYHRGTQRFVRDLNRFYQDEAALWEADYDLSGFFWIDCGDADDSVFSFVRQNRDGSRRVAVIMNLTPVLRNNYRIGLPQGGFWREAVNSDSSFYGGSNQGNFGGIRAEEYQVHHQPFSGSFTLPPLSVIAFRAEGG